MKSKTDFFLKALHVISWIIFIGLCIVAGGLITNAIATLMLNPAGAERFWKEVDLTSLYEFNQSYFITITSIMIIVAVMKAVMFYLIVKLFYDKKLNLSEPFNEMVGGFISNMGYLSLGIGLFSSWGAKTTQWLVSQKVVMPDLENMHLGGGDVWLFMSVILLVIAQIFKKGIEIQNENELTI